MPSPHCNGSFAPSPHTQNQLVQHFLRTDAYGEEVPPHNSDPDYRPSIENVELSSPVQHNASPDKNSRTSVMVSFLVVTGIKPCPDLSPNKNALRIASGTEPILIRKEDKTPLISCPIFCALCTTVNCGVGGQLSTGGSVHDGGRIGPLCEGVWPH
ncbi:uncharacterized protein TNCV_3258561 [Trichonephila clavipes]|nr:uncharacterized protein TNCV_3258561 [Trichonephila clavipes]